MAAAGLPKADVAREIWSRAAIPVERFPASAHPVASYAFVEKDGLVYPVAGPETCSSSSSAARNRRTRPSSSPPTVSR